MITLASAHNYHKKIRIIILFVVFDIGMNNMDLIRKKFLQISSSRPGCLVLIAFSFAPALAVMGLIYFFSSQNAALSSELSYPITEELVHALDRLFSLELSEAELIAASGIYHSFVRKLAHMTEYAALAVTLFLPFRLWHIPCPRISAWCFCLVYAALDEFHQRFSFGRSPSFGDVFIDVSGAIIGLLLVSAVLALLKKRQPRISS